VAIGAALIAGGIVRPPTEYYPHTIGIFVHRKQKGVMVESFLPIIEAGEMPPGQGKPGFARDSTGKLFVEFGSYMCADTRGPAFDTV